jgi:hypothetical protein
MRTALLALIVVLAAGCPKPRTSAATQPTPAAFDPAKSDPKAIAIADAGLAAVGGHDKWEAVKELTFGVKYVLAGVPKSDAVHRWDRWNGRHNYMSIDMATTQTGKPDDVKVTEVRHDLFNTSAKPFVTYGGQELMRADADKAATAAGKQLSEDAYKFTIVHRVRDPGVHLAVATETEMPTQCDPGCESIKITFDPEVGKETWYIAYNSSTHVPEVIANEKGPGRIVGFKIVGWIEAGGLKFPAKLQNIALADEVIEYGGVAIGEPEDATYMRSINE